MKMTKRWLSVLLCVIMTVMAFAVTVVAAGGETNVEFVADKTAVSVDDTFTISFRNKEMTVKGFTGGFTFDTTLLECVSIVGVDPDYPDDFSLISGGGRGGVTYTAPTAISSIEQANANGTVGYAYAGVKDVTYLENTLYIVTFKAKDAGTANFTLYEQSNGTDAFASDNIDTIVVTIKSATTECSHEYEYDCSKICKLCDVETRPEATHTVDPSKTAYSVSSDPQCCVPGNQWKDTYCACGYKFDPELLEGTITATGEHTLSKIDQVDPTCRLAGHKEYWECDKMGFRYEDAQGMIKIDDIVEWAYTEVGAGYIPADPDAHGTIKYENYFYGTHDELCEDCGKPVREDVPCSGGTATCYDRAQCYYCGYEYGELAAHSFNSKDSGKQASAADCTNPAKNYVQCDNCDAVSDTKTVEVGTATGHGKVLGFRYDNINYTTHTKYCSDCDTEIETIDHDFTNDPATSQCICGEWKSYVVIMDFNGGIGGTDNTYPEYPFEFTKPNLAWVRDVLADWGTDIMREGYTFKGWTSVKDDASTLIDIDTFDVTKDVTTIYALWEEKHVCAHDYYDITATTHKSICSCGEAIGEPEEHYFNTVDSTCICGAKFTGWDGKVYYKDAVMQTGWTEIDGAWYYLDTVTGVRAEGLTRVPYPTVDINGWGYEPNPEDIAYAEKKGETFIDATEAWFLFDEDGKFYQYSGIMEYKGANRYLHGGIMEWHFGMVTTKDGVNYYFVGDAENGGNIAAEGIVYITRIAGYDDFKPGYVIFKDGQIDDSKDISIESVTNSKGETNSFYFENGICVPGKGLVMIEEGKYIFVRSAGQLAIGEYWVTPEKANGLVKGGRIYVFDENGYMTSDVSKNGIVDGKYYVEGELTYAGLIEIDGAIYYINSTGKVVTGTYYVTKTNGMEGFSAGDKLVFGDDGKMETVKDGIVEENGELYYYEKNHLMCGAGLIELDGDIYYVRSSGEVQTGYFYIAKTNDIEGFKTGDKCKFDEDGKLLFVVQAD